MWWCYTFIAAIPLIAAAVSAGVAIKNNVDNNNAKKKELEELARHQRKIEESISQENKLLGDTSGKVVNKEALYEMYPGEAAAEVKGSSIPIEKSTPAPLEFMPLKTSDFTSFHIKVFMRDCIPKPLLEKYGVINYDDASGKGTHWVCFYRTTPKTAYFFDPYENANPPKELVHALGVDTQIRINITNVQKKEEPYPICGHLCLTFLKLMEIGKHPTSILENLEKHHLEYATLQLASLKNS